MNGEFRVGDWLVQRDLNRLSKGEKSVQVEPKVMEVLVFLAGQPGEVLSRQSILKAVWPDTYVSDEVLTYSIFELRHAFEDDAKHPQIIQTIPRRGYRLIAPVTPSSHAFEPQEFQTLPAQPSKDPVVQPPSAPIPRAPRLPIVPLRLNRAVYIVAAGATALLAFLLLWYHPWSSALEPTDFILLTDFVNTTGDPVFDGTLKHALAMHLGQSPFLNIFPEERARETLPYMERQADATIDRETGREICIRRGIKALLVGSIDPLGKVYVISLEVLNGQTGDVIAREQLEVESKEGILRSLGTVATNLRRRLGETMKSVENFDVPLEQATTASLEAFKAYSTGRKHLISGQMTDAIPHYRRALEFDPNFASVYDDLAWCYDALAQHERAAECATKAFALRDRVSEYERLSISSIYYTMATGELDKAIETLEMMRTIYPRSAPVHNTLGGRYMVAGETERAMESFREAIRLTRHPNAYSGLASACIRLNRFQEAKGVIVEARSQGIDNRNLHLQLYTIAFLQGDPAAMIEQVRWASGKQDEAFILGLQANAAAVSGQLEKAREYFRQAIETARRHELMDAAAEFTAEAGRWEAFFGNTKEACDLAANALNGSRNWRVLLRAAMTLAKCGRPDEAQLLAEEMAGRFPTNTYMQNVSLPVVRAFIELTRSNPAEVLSLVEARRGNSSRVSLWPAYLAGEAYLRRGSGPEARVEFQDVLDHRGVEPLSPVIPLAKLGLARALAASGEKERGRKAYQDFFASWTNADQDAPLFRLALSEYAGLK